MREDTMKIHAGILTLVAALLVWGCTRPESASGQDGIFTAVFESSSEELGNWNPGDEISVNGYLYRTSEGGKRALFAPVSEPAPEASVYMAVFPADLKVDGTTVSGSLSGSMRVQEDGTLSREYLPAAAKSSDRKLTFYRLFSYVSVCVMSEDVTDISVCSNGTESICGNYSADFSDIRPSVAVSGGGSEMTVDARQTCFDKGAEICIPVLPRTLKSGFKFSASIGQGNQIWEKSTTDHTVFHRGRMLDLGDFFYDQASGLGRLDFDSSVEVMVDCTAPLSEPVSSMLFGSFSEMHGGDLVPGILEQYVVNTSFEPWVATGVKGEVKNELVYSEEDIPVDADVAYPWEKRIISGQAAFSTVSEEKFNTLMSQKVSVGAGARAVLLQRMALPFYRTDRYKVRFWSKADGDVSLKLSFHDVGSKEGGVLSDVFTTSVSSEGWTEYKHEFSLKKSSSLFNDRHSQYNLWFEFEGSGAVYLDHVTLFPLDCVEGIFNPETIRYFREYGIRAVRWPGGNYTSGYNWKNGIGPWKDRPCLNNMAWGGLDSNLLGTDEFMRFCELTGAEPVMGVGYNPSLISHQDIADWVEYCNGSASSAYGSKRALNGNDTPYGVKYWGIGNEVYGNYQIGSVGAASYSEGLSSISRLIKSVDPSICVLASGRGVHNQYRGAYQGWTEMVASGAASAFDALDCHMYVYGNDKSADLGLDGAGWFRVFAAANLNLRDFIDFFRTAVPDKKLAFMEWGVLPRLSGRTYQTPQRQTFANLLVSACIYNEMIRNSDVVSMAALHNFSFYVSPHKLHSEPVNMRTLLIKELAVMEGGYALPVNHVAVSVYEQTYDMLDVGVRESVPELDVAAVRKGDYVYVSCVNRSLSETYSLDCILEGVSFNAMSGRTYTCLTPFAQNHWNSLVDCTVEPVVTGADAKLSVPPLSYTFLKMSVGD